MQQPPANRLIKHSLKIEFTTGFQASDGQGLGLVNKRGLEVCVRVCVCARARVCACVGGVGSGEGQQGEGSGSRMYFGVTYFGCDCGRQVRSGAWGSGSVRGLCNECSAGLAVG